MSELISIVVPVYGVEKYLRQCVESVLAQTYPVWELILVDDGSPDLSGAICDEYAAKDSRVRVIHRENGGMSAARNSGLDVAKGEYVSFIDSDDAVAEDYLEVLYDLIMVSEADVACADYIEVNDLADANSDINTDIKRDKRDASSRSMNGREFTAIMLYQKSRICNNSVCCKLFRREIFNKFRFKEGIGYEDLEICFRLFPTVGKIAVTDRIFYYYRQHSASYTHVFTPRRADVLDVTDSMVGYFSRDKKDSTLLRAARSRRLSAHFNILGLLAASGNEACESFSEEEKKMRERLEARCWKGIKEERRHSLLDESVRFKNKAGILLSFFGKSAYKLFARFIYR